MKIFLYIALIVFFISGCSSNWNHIGTIVKEKRDFSTCDKIYNSKHVLLYNSCDENEKFKE